MKKLYSFLFLFVFCFTTHRTSAQLLSFSFAGSNGDEGNWSSASEAAGVMPSTVWRGPGIMAAANADRFNSKNWTTSSTPDFNDYLEFTIKPNPGYSISLSTIVLQHQRSHTGPRSFVIRTSFDNYSADATNAATVPDVNTNQSTTFTFPTAVSTTSPLTVRVYAYNAVSATGTWGPGESADGNDIVLSGSFLTILPVKFVNVNAAWKGKDVEVKWTNATESDLLYYSVERSGDGQSFKELAKVYPENKGGLAEYRSLDLQPLSKTNFYRIKAVETNGHVSYTNIVRIETSLIAASMGLYPNPVMAGSQITMQLSGMSEGDYEIRIYNAAAQLLHRECMTVNGMSSTQRISLPNGQRGMYVAEITGKQTLQQRFVIQ